MDYSVLKQQIFGQPSLAVYLSGFFFVLIITLYKKSRKAKKTRNSLSQRTPIDWDWKFFLVDNLRDLLSIFVITFLFFRFSNYLITKYLSVVGEEVDLMLYATILGFLSTYIQEGLEIIECRLGKLIVKKANTTELEQ